MKKLAFLVALAVLVVIPLTASAEAPAKQVFEWKETWEVDNPCTAEYDLLEIISTSTVREIVHNGVGRFTQVSYDINVSDPWVGRGTATGVELWGPSESQNESASWIVTNTESGQRFRFGLWAHFNGITGEWVGGNYALECIKA